MALRRSAPVASRLFSTRVGSAVGSISEATENTVNDSDTSNHKSPASQKTAESASNSLSSLPMAGLASYLGEKFNYQLDEIVVAQKQRLRPKEYSQVFEPPQIPHILPLTRWAAQSEQVKETLVIDDTQPRRARLSWYHPDDTMIPRGWFVHGLLEDIKFYRPFLKKKK